MTSVYGRACAENSSRTSSTSVPCKELGCLCRFHFLPTSKTDDDAGSDNPAYQEIDSDSTFPVGTRSAGGRRLNDAAGPDPPSVARGRHLPAVPGDRSPLTAADQHRQRPPSNRASANVYSELDTVVDGRIRTDDFDPYSSIAEMSQATVGTYDVIVFDMNPVTASVSSAAVTAAAAKLDLYSIPLKSSNVDAVEATAAAAATSQGSTAHRRTTVEAAAEEDTTAENEGDVDATEQLYARPVKSTRRAAAVAAAVDLVVGVNVDDTECLYARPQKRGRRSRTSVKDHVDGGNDQTDV